MSLISSCGALYFPTTTPKDNIIKLQWSEAPDTAHKPHTMVIYKVKCTAPHLFHVLPRYGALLVADASGSTPIGFKGGSIVFALKENYAQGDASAATQTSPSSSPQTSGSGRHQQRFSVEYVEIRSEPLAYQQVVQSLTDQVRLTDVVKNVWSLVSADAITSSHVGKPGALKLKVFSDNVVLTATEPSPTGNEKTKIVVPPEATLVAPSLQDRLSHSVPRQSDAVGKQADELRALKEELHTLRADQSGSVTSPSGRRGRSGSMGSASVTSQPDDVASADAILMKLPGDTDAAAGGKKKKGLKLYLLLLIMFVVYLLGLFFTRGGSAVAAKVGGKSVVVAGGKTSSQSNTTAAQPTLRAKPPQAELPATDNNVIQL